MASIRQEKIAGVIQKELSLIFQKEARTICMGAMVSVTIVRYPLIWELLKFT